MFNLSGKTALVTGASGGIGGAIARALHSQGASVVLSGTKLESLQTLAKELDVRVAIAPCNLSDSAAVDRLIGEAEAALDGKIDILVNNAGVTRDNLSMRMKDDEWQSVLDINLSAAFRLCKAATRGMMKRRFGRIISITSVVGVTGNPGQANYAAAKAGLVGMTKSLAQELASRNITVNCVAPGFITTAMTDGLPEVQKIALTSRIPAGRLGNATDVASAVIYLASDEASYVTGQSLHVNGGMAMI